MYIRFKNIPPNEISGVYDGDLGKIRNELGVSCYECYKIDNVYKIILPSLDLGCLYDLINFIESHVDNEIPVYLIDGDKVGLGTYGEPVIKNITILCELKVSQLQIPKPIYKMDKTNPQLLKK